MKNLSPALPANILFWSAFLTTATQAQFQLTPRDLGSAPGMSLSAGYRTRAGLNGEPASTFQIRFHGALGNVIRTDATDRQGGICSNADCSLRVEFLPFNFPITFVLPEGADINGYLDGAHIDLARIIDTSRGLNVSFAGLGREAMGPVGPTSTSLPLFRILDAHFVRHFETQGRHVIIASINAGVGFSMNARNELQHPVIQGSIDLAANLLDRRVQVFSGVRFIAHDREIAAPIRAGAALAFGSRRATTVGFELQHWLIAGSATNDGRTNPSNNATELFLTLTLPGSY